MKRVQSSEFSARRNRWQDKRQRKLARLAAMRAAKARKREALIAEGWEPEPKFNRFFPLAIGVRDKLTGDTCWIDLKSVRDATRRISVILRHYVPGAASAP
jgi:hypothetical protein